MRSFARILGFFACQKPKQDDYKSERNYSVMKHVWNIARILGILAKYGKQTSIYWKLFKNMSLNPS